MEAGTEYLNEFIANNYDLERLEARLSEFNPLKILKSEHNELKHSNILGWLLDPKANHKLGSQFLRKFISENLLNNDTIDTELSIFKIQEFSYDDIIVKREWNNIDMLVYSNKNKWVLLIENKIHSKESKNQLGRYYSHVKNQFGGYEIIPIFLTVDEDTPSDSRYGMANYQQVLKILEFIVSINKEDMNSKIFDFLTYYLKTLEMLTMENDDIKMLCKKIYQDHSEAIDLINKYSAENSFEAAAASFLERINLEESYVDSRTAWFLPSELAEKLPKNCDPKWSWGYPLAVWYRARNNRLGIILEVGPILDSSLRIHFLKYLRKFGFKISDRALEPERKYTRIFTKYIDFEDWDNGETIIAKMDDLYYKSAKKPYINLLEACDSYDWELYKK